MTLLVWSYQELFPGRRRYDDIPITAIFALPRLGQGVNIVQMQAAGSAYSSHGVPDDLQVPFECEPQTRLLVFSTALIESSLDFTAFRLFAPAKTIEQYCHDPWPRHVSWQELAPHIRLIQKKTPILITNSHIFHIKCICLDRDEIKD